MTLEDDPWVKESSAFGTARLHALGCVSINWNSCEHEVQDLLGIVAGIKTSIARALSHDFGNVSIWSKIIGVAEVRGHPEDVLETMRFAARLFDRNRINRNTLVHATLEFNNDHTGMDDILKLVRVRGMRQERDDITADLSTLRRVADDISGLRKYLRELTVATYLRLHPELKGLDGQPMSPMDWPERPQIPVAVVPPRS